jgi:hypothetical protein
MAPRWLAFLIAAPPAAAQTEILELAGEAPGDRFGWSIAFVGDLDGDGRSDLAVGAPFHDTAGIDAGRVHVFSGSGAQVIRTWDGLAGELYFGHSIAAAGDVDSDGTPDVLVGSSTFWPPAQVVNPVVPGYVQLISGASGAILQQFDPPANVESFGYAVAGTSDIDGDGVGDVLIGAPGHPSGDVGYVYVHSAATGERIRRDGVANTTNFGFALAVLGDLDLDGIDDYAAGAPWADNASTGHFGHPGGWVSVHSGATGDVLWSADAGGQFGSQFGWSLAGAGDSDGDGVAELLVGQRWGGGGMFTCGAKGHLQVRSGAGGSLLRDHVGLNGCGSFGTSASGVGDLDGDGVEDYASGEAGWVPGIDPDQPLRVFDGASGGLIATVASPAPAPSRAGWGFALSAGDANGDGLQDLLIGGPWYDGAGPDAGVVYVYSIALGVKAYCEAQLNSQGCTSAIAGMGAPSASSPAPFLIEAAPVLNQKNGLLLYGYTPVATPFMGGTKCVQVPARTPLQSSGGNPVPPEDCSGLFSYDFNALIQSATDPALVPGAAVFAQYWSRDPQSASTTNLTDALAFQIGP